MAEVAYMSHEGVLYKSLNELPETPPALAELMGIYPEELFGEDPAEQPAGIPVAVKVFLEHHEVADLLSGKRAIADVLADELAQKTVKLAGGGIRGVCEIGGHQGVTLIRAFFSRIALVPLPGNQL